jgi:hypothetical protein
VNLTDGWTASHRARHDRRRLLRLHRLSGRQRNLLELLGIPFVPARASSPSSVPQWWRVRSAFSGTMHLPLGLQGHGLARHRGALGTIAVAPSTNWSSP